MSIELEKWPKKVYLHQHSNLNYIDEATWDVTKNGDSDIEYIRADVFNQLNTNSELPSVHISE